MTAIRVEYRMTSQDVSDQWKFNPRIAWSNAGRLIWGLVIVGYGARDISITGPSLFSGFTLIVGCWFVFSNTIMRCIMQRMASYFDAKVSMLINDENLTTELITRNQPSPTSRTMSWTSFSSRDNALEHPNAYEIRHGRGGLWIPKRAFSTDEESRFRTLVAEKMGERCKFR